LYEKTKLIAVGIETNEELKMLRKLDVYGGQGFLFGEQKKLLNLNG
jgi:EAL domain-containing protein (putative c-di-GMP-specific phosphodiesterase class I)